jgi:hypothetical protein
MLPHDASPIPHIPLVRVRLNKLPKDKMVKLWKLLLQNPFRSCRFLYAFGTQILLIGLKAILLPTLPRYQSVRLQLHRAYWSSSSYYFPEIIHRLPVTNCPEALARRVGSTFTGYVIPGTVDLAVSSGDKRRCVVVYAHGGGYARGEARMYLNYMDRWVKGAAEAGLEIVFLSVEYRTLYVIDLSVRRRRFC